MALWREGIMLTLLGMGVVFASLALLMGVIEALNRLFAPRAGEALAPEGAGAEASPDHLPLVIAAALARYLEAGRAAVFTLPVRREDGAGWARQGRLRSPLGRGR